MDVQDIVNTVSQKAGLDQATTEKVVGTIFSVLEHAADGNSASSFFAKIHGAVSAKGKQQALEKGLESFFGSVAEFAPLFVGVSPLITDRWMNSWFAHSKIICWWIPGG